jgi:hypothetical protein
MASYPIAQSRAIAPFYAAKLKSAGIRSTVTLLKRTATPKLRRELSNSASIPMKLIVDWANIADLTRVRGIALDYAELLVAAGVDTVKDLSRRNAVSLVTRLTEANRQKPLVDLLPTEKRVAGWIEAAKSLTPGMGY